jgi:cell division protein ZapA
MAEVTISLNGRPYEIACDAGQEGRVVDLAAYIDQRLQQIARSGAAYNDAHLMVLTALVLADELFEAKESPLVRQAKINAPVAAPAAGREEEQALVRLLDQLTRRIEGIAQRLQAA